MAVQSSVRKSRTTNPRRRPPSKTNKKPKQKGSWIVPALGLTAIALLSAMAGAILAISFASVPLSQTKLTEKQAAVFNQEKTIDYSALTIPQLSRPVNILVLGTKVLNSDVGLPKGDQEQHFSLVNSLEGLTDTIMLLRFDPEQKTVTLLSIPRDTQAQIEGHGLRKINEANAHGGPSLAAQSISHLLGGLTIDRYLRVNVQAVEKLVDALGGVTVYVPKRMKYQDDSQHLYINLQEGEQHLNGNQTLQLLRFRKDAMGDIGRIQRQQMVTRALMEQSLKPQTILKLPEILAIVQSHIDTNLTLEELVAIAGFTAKTDRSNIQMLMLPGYPNGNGRRGVSYWLPNTAKLETLMRQYFGLTVWEASWNAPLDPADEVPNDATLSSINSVNAEDAVNAEGDRPFEPSNQYADNTFGEPVTPDSDFSLETSPPLRIAIQSQPNQPDAAQRLANYLRQAGYTQVFLVDSWPQPLKTTRIIAPQGDHQGAAKVRADLGLGEVLIDSNGYLISDVTVQVGQDWIERAKGLAQ